MMLIFHCIVSLFPMNNQSRILISILRNKLNWFNIYIKKKRYRFVSILFIYIHSFIYSYINIIYLFIYLLNYYIFKFLKNFFFN